MCAYVHNDFSLMINGNYKLLALPWAKNIYPVLPTYSWLILGMKSYVKCKPLVMFKFIGDMFFIWNHPRDGLIDFIDLFNSHDKSIETV